MLPVCECSLEWSFIVIDDFETISYAISARLANIGFSFAVRASAHLLVTVAVPSLSKHLVAVLARVRSLASMCSNMVQNVAHFNETLAAGETLETLISATSYLVDYDLLLEAFIIGLGNSFLSNHRHRVLGRNLVDIDHLLDASLNSLGNSFLANHRHRILGSGCLWFVGMFRCYFNTLKREFLFFWIIFSCLESRRVNIFLANHRHRILGSRCFWYFRMLRSFLFTLERDFPIFCFSFVCLQCRW